jgi:hypothetical protein
LLVDYASDDRPIGIEITAPSMFSLDQLNLLLTSLGQETLAAEDASPLAA